MTQGLANTAARLFSNPAGDYGSMVNERVGAGTWESGEELGDTWASRNSFRYGWRVGRIWATLGRPGTRSGMFGGWGGAGRHMGVQELVQVWLEGGEELGNTWASRESFQFGSDGWLRWLQCAVGKRVVCVSSSVGDL